MVFVDYTRSFLYKTTRCSELFKERIPKQNQHSLIFRCIRWLPAAYSFNYVIKNCVTRNMYN